MVASRNPVSYILKTSVTRSNSLADNLGAWGGILSLGSFFFPVVVVPVAVSLVVVAPGIVPGPVVGIPVVGPVAVAAPTAGPAPLVGAVVAVAVAVAILCVV